MAEKPCPFCGATVAGALCDRCGRDPTASRRVCPTCKQMTPTAETVCCHCGARIRSELAWKIPLIVAIFAAAFALAFILNAMG
jgi:predicted amidophosphoribosyltransferase